MRDSKKAALTTRIWTADKPQTRRASKRRASDASTEETAATTQSAKKTKVMNSEAEARTHSTSRSLGAPAWTVQSSESEPEDKTATDNTRHAKKPRESESQRIRLSVKSSSQSHPETAHDGTDANNDGNRGSEDEESICLESEEEPAGSGSDGVEDGGEDAEWAQLSDGMKEAEVPRWTTISDAEEDRALTAAMAKSSQKTRTEGNSRTQNTRTTQIALSKCLNQSSSHLSISSDESSVEHTVLDPRRSKSKPIADEKKVSKGVEKRRQAQRELEVMIALKYRTILLMCKPGAQVPARRTRQRRRGS
ncbi:hypothetical protein NUW54_g472 [Trametes sanguinea]|uniref:Uncharacterized protein n=1 Tax=Trametes sanguinea TaxID=158606 RepID=A0ACC1Q9N3_9APHY|nr:hypothetical protein NUW54_g472 [Trametes sanguinea]